MPEDSAFVLFPYLRTSQAVDVCGLNLASTADVTTAPDKSGFVLESIRQLFFLNNHQQISRMTVSPVDLSTPGLLHKLNRARAYLTFLYGSVGPDGESFFTSDHSTFYVVLPSKRISQFQVTTEGLTTNLWPEPNWPEFDRFFSAPGYEILKNGIELTGTFDGGRIYPPADGLWLNHNQDLYSDYVRLADARSSWPIVRFFSDEPDISDALEAKILNSLGWYGRSISLGSDAEESLLHLAIALECLLDLEQGERITERFIETVTIILGKTKRLNSWAKQFYDARSKIVHMGYSPNLAFIPSESKDGKKKGLPGFEPHRSLREFGMAVYRMCLVAILTGAYIARDGELEASLVPNSERILAIKKQLESTKTDPKATLNSVAEDVLDLDTYHFRSEHQVNMELYLAVAGLMCRLAAEASLITDSETVKVAQTVESSKASAKERHAGVVELARQLSQWRKTKYNYAIVGKRGQLEQIYDDPLLVLATFSDFLSGPSFKLQIMSLEEN